MILTHTLKVLRLFKTTIFCPSCGTANRDDSEMCSECGSLIPKITSDTHSERTQSKNSAHFGVAEPPPPPQDFNIDVSSPLPPPPPDFSSSTGYSSVYRPYDQSGYQQPEQKIVCERCGTVLKSDDRQCPGCGKPLQVSTTPSQISYGVPQPYSTNQSERPLPPPPPGTPYPPSSQTQLPYPPPAKSKPQTPTKPTTNIAKCAKCGAIVYDYETRCSNCNRVLSPVSPSLSGGTTEQSKVPVGAARCGRCNAIVYPNQSTCSNCGKPLAPVSMPYEPYQRISRCKRCSHVVYPTDTNCPNCGRKLDPL